MRGSLAKAAVENRLKAIKASAHTSTRARILFSAR